MEIPKVIVFNGRRYHLGTKGKYYFTSKMFRWEITSSSLHRDIWEDHYKMEIPEGYQIHHIDGNTFNNDIKNLECILASEHYKHKKRIDKEWQKKHLERIREMAAEWHRSEEGRKWHRDHVKNQVANRKYKTGVCEWCGRSYEYLYKTSRFCSSKCLNQHTVKKNGIEKKCPICGEVFYSPKTRDQKTCSYACGAKYRARRL